MLKLYRPFFINLCVIGLGKKSSQSNSMQVSSSAFDEYVIMKIHMFIHFAVIRTLLFIFTTVLYIFFYFILDYTQKTSATI